MTSGTALEHGAKLSGGFREQLARPPVDDYAVLPNQIEGIEFLTAILRGNGLGICIEPGVSVGANMFAFAGRGCRVDLVLGKIDVDLTYDDPIVFPWPARLRRNRPRRPRRPSPDRG